MSSNLMGVSLYPTGDGGGTSALSPKAAKNYFEFFLTGSHREVLLLGDLQSQPVHFVKSKGHKVLCGSQHGVCELCERAAFSDDVGTQQVEYYAPAYIRQWKERMFHQRVAVFTTAGGEQVLRTIEASGQTQCRGQRLEVERYSHGNSGRFRIKPMEGLPKGFPGVLPPAFDLVPFIRARFGRPQDPSRPLVLLPSFRAVSVTATAVNRPKPLAIPADDCRLTAEEIAAFRSRLRATNAAEPERPATLPIDPRPVPVVPTAPAAAEPPVEPVEDVPEVLAAIVRPGAAKPSDEPTDFGKLTELKILDGQLPYGPRHLVQGPPTAEEEAEALAHGTGKLLCDEVKRSSVFARKPGTNGHHTAKGGAQ